MGKKIGGKLGTLAVSGCVLFLLFRFGGLGLGKGNGNGDDGDVKMETTVDESQTIVDEAEEITITIVVTQDQYLIDGQQVTLTQIKEKVTDESAIVSVVLEDNYASAKAWDDIKTNLAEWGIIPIEQ